MQQVCTGIAVCTWGADKNNTEFAWIGFFYIIGSAISAGFRWSLSQLYLQEKFFTPKIRPITLLYFVLPAAFATLLPFFFYLEHAKLLVYIKSLPPNGALKIIAMCSVVVHSHTRKSQGETYSPI